MGCNTSRGRVSSTNSTISSQARESVVSSTQLPHSAKPANPPARRTKQWWKCWAKPSPAAVVPDEDSERLGSALMVSTEDLSNLPAMKLSSPGTGVVVVHEDHTLAAGALGHAVPHHEHDLPAPPPLIGLVSVRSDSASTRQLLHELHTSTFLQVDQGSSATVRVVQQGSSRNVLATMGDMEQEAASSQRPSRARRPHAASVTSRVGELGSDDGVEASRMTAASIDSSLVLSGASTVGASVDNSMSLSVSGVGSSLMSAPSLAASGVSGFNSAEAHRAALLNGYADEATAFVFGGQAGRPESPNPSFMLGDSRIDDAQFSPVALQRR